MYFKYVYNIKLAYVFIFYIQYPLEQQQQQQNFFNILLIFRSTIILYFIFLFFHIGCYEIGNLCILAHFTFRKIDL